MYQNYRGRDSLFWQARDLTHTHVAGDDIVRAFRSVVSGLEDVRDLRHGGSALVFSKIRTLISEYFPKGAGLNRWLQSLGPREQERVLQEFRPVSATTQFCLSAETAVDGVYVRTQPRLALARIDEAIAHPISA
jgi:hypothetical protein